MEYGLPGPAHSSESPFSLSWILKGVYLGRVLQNPSFHKLDLTRLYLYWSIILSLSSVSMKKEGAFICKRLYFCKTTIVPFYLFFLGLPLGMCTSSNHGGCQGSGRSLWGEHLLWKMLEKCCSDCFCHLEKNSDCFCKYECQHSYAYRLKPEMAAEEQDGLFIAHLFGQGHKVLTHPLRVSSSSRGI